MDTGEVAQTELADMPVPASEDSVPAPTDSVPAPTDPFPAPVDPAPAPTDPVPTPTDPVLDSLVSSLTQSEPVTVGTMDPVPVETYSAPSQTELTPLEKEAVSLEAHSPSDVAEIQHSSSSVSQIQPLALPDSEPVRQASEIVPGQSKQPCTGEFSPLENSTQSKDLIVNSYGYMIPNVTV